MKLAVLRSRALAGVQAPAVSVEVHLANGLPSLTIVGLPDAGVREAKDRVRAALQNSGFEVPSRRITINLAPAELPKESGRFDLPIALGILAASDQIPMDELDGYEFAGELSLSGALRPVRGALAMSFAMRREAGPGASPRAFILPAANADEAALVRDAAIHPARTLLEVCAHFAARQGEARLARHRPDASFAAPVYPDFADVKGQQHVKRALEVAAAGLHSVLLVGPPGAGKSMLAARFPGLLPALTEDEALEAAAVQSLAGSFAIERWRRRPLRSPHHSCSGVALVGGGAVPRPGEVSLAHHGVLFLDELPEFDRKVLEVLREPLETGTITIARAAHHTDFPGALPADRRDEPLPLRLAGPFRPANAAAAGCGAALPGPHFRAAARPHRLASAGGGHGAGNHGGPGRWRTEQRGGGPRRPRARAPASAPGQGQPLLATREIDRHCVSMPPPPACCASHAAPALVGARLPPGAEGGAHGGRPGRCRHRRSPSMWPRPSSTAAAWPKAERRGRRTTAPPALLPSGHEDPSPAPPSAIHRCLPRRLPGRL